MIVRGPIGSVYEVEDEKGGKPFLGFKVRQMGGSVKFRCNNRAQYREVQELEEQGAEIEVRVQVTCDKDIPKAGHIASINVIDPSTGEVKRPAGAAPAMPRPAAAGKAS